MVSVSMHTTPTIDYDFVISGEVTLVLEDGEVTLGPGDAAIVPGVPHAWRSGATGCVLVVALIGAAGSK
jgi:quercetin dioxygenase-like cupin family protein